MDQESTTLTLSLTGTPADFNGNDWIDGSDFLIWQTGYGIESGATQSDGDSDGDGDVDDVDLAHWQLQFGKRIVGYPAAAATAVPEPSSCLLVFALLGMFAARKWGKRVFSTSA